jgi:hypothetical protein
MSIRTPVVSKLELELHTAPPATAMSVIAATTNRACLFGGAYKPCKAEMCKQVQPVKVEAIQGIHRFVQQSIQEHSTVATPTHHKKQQRGCCWLMMMLLVDDVDV